MRLACKPGTRSSKLPSCGAWAASKRASFAVLDSLGSASELGCRMETTLPLVFISTEYLLLGSIRPSTAFTVWETKLADGVPPRPSGETFRPSRAAVLLHHDQSTSAEEKASFRQGKRRGQPILAAPASACAWIP